jgi:hypothetical protein
MRARKRQALAEAETLALAALERARLALHQRPNGPERQPQPASQFQALPALPTLAARQPMAWLRQQPELATIGLNVSLCLFGLLSA